MIRDFMVDPDNHMAHPERYSNSTTNTLGAYYFSVPLHCRTASNVSRTTDNLGSVVVANGLEYSVFAPEP